ncbi:MAG: TRAP transporter large permease subunit [Rhodopila sp.]|nr:TRAP transporter large permease subunit [Rhodopila sp.]
MIVETNGAVLPGEIPPEAAAGAAHGAVAQTAIERAIGAVAAVVGGALVVVEVIILLWGVTTRYVLEAPSLWTDETAIILFIWLTMIGAVLGFQRSEHMRMTTAVEMLPRPWQPWINAFAQVVGVVFLAVTTYYAVIFMIQQYDLFTPQFEIPDSWRASALPISFVLMLLMAVVRLRLLQPKHLAAAVGVNAVIFLLLWMFQATWLSMGPMSLTIFFGPLVFLFIFAGTPIAFSFGLATTAYLAFSTHAPLTITLARIDTGVSNLLLLAVPLFIYLGVLIEVTGMARYMVNFLVSLLGHVRGGLEYVLLGAIFLISGISGSKIADMAAVAPILVPEMKKRGNDPAQMVALLAAACAMSETIPPSIVLIAIGAVAGVSIAGLFAGGILPAATAALALVIFVGWRARKWGTVTPRASARTMVYTFFLAIPGLALPFLIRAFVLGGVTTATEVSTIGIAYALVVGILTWKQVQWGRMLPILAETASLSGVVLFIVGCATAMAWALTQSGFSHALTVAMTTVGGGPIVFMAISMVVFVVLGSVLEGMPVIVLLAPLLFPVARALHINDVHYAIVCILAMGIGLFAPPFGLGFYGACAIGRASPDETMRHIWPLLGVLVIALAVIIAFPIITTIML